MQKSDLLCLFNNSLPEMVDHGEFVVFAVYAG